MASPSQNLMNEARSNKHQIILFVIGHGRKEVNMKATLKSYLVYHFSNFLRHDPKPFCRLIFHLWVKWRSKSRSSNSKTKIVESKTTRSRLIIRRESVLSKACFKRRATSVLSWLDWSSTAERHRDDMVSDVELIQSNRTAVAENKTQK